MNKRELLKQLVLRVPVTHNNRLHKQAQLKRAQYSQEPEPLKYKLDTPGQILPFRVNRSFNGNLPIYRKYWNGREFPRTVIRHIEGDVNEFTKELRKVCSNADIKEKIGRVEINGSHVESVQKWLKGLGF